MRSYRTRFVCAGGVSVESTQKLGGIFPVDSVEDERCYRHAFYGAGIRGKRIARQYVCTRWMISKSFLRTNDARTPVLLEDVTRIRIEPEPRRGDAKSK
jgi:hypothetical protein